MGFLPCKGFQEVRGVTTGYKGLHEETLDYNRLQGLQGVTRGYKRLQGITRGYRGLQGVGGG